MLNWTIEPGRRFDVGGETIQWTVSVFPIPGGWRMFLSSYGTTYKMVSAVSPNQLNWCQEPGIRLNTQASTDFSTYLMWMSAPVWIGAGWRTYLGVYGGATAAYRILSAVSPDQLNWTVEPGRRLDVQTGTDWSGGVLYAFPVRLPGGGIRLFLRTGTGAIYSAISADGLNFCMEPGRRLDIQASMDYSYYFEGGFQVIRLPGGGYRMFTCATVNPTLFRILSAVSPDMLNWTMEPGRRLDVVGSGDTGAYVMYPYIVENPKGGWRMFFIGQNSTDNKRHVMSAVASF